MVNLTFRGAGGNEKSIISSDIIALINVLHFMEISKEKCKALHPVYCDGRGKVDHPALDRYAQIGVIVDPDIFFSFDLTLDE